MNRYEIKEKTGLDVGNKYLWFLKSKLHNVISRVKFKYVIFMTNLETKLVSPKYPTFPKHVQVLYKICGKTINETRYHNPACMVLNKFYSDIIRKEWREYNEKKLIAYKKISIFYRFIFNLKKPYHTEFKLPLNIAIIYNDASYDKTIEVKILGGHLIYEQNEPIQKDGFSEVTIKLQDKKSPDKTIIYGEEDIEKILNN